jgi:hypothetical protein
MRRCLECVVLCSLVAAGPARGQTAKPSPGEALGEVVAMSRCWAIDGRPFDVQIRATGGEDERWQRNVYFALPGKPPRRAFPAEAEYSFREPLSSRSPCAGTAAEDVSKTRVIVLLTIPHPIEGPTLAAVLWDAATGKVLDSRSDLGSARDFFLVRLPGALPIHATFYTLYDAAWCSEQCPQVLGKQPLSITNSSLETRWMMGMQGDRLALALDAKATHEMSEERKDFPDRALFSRAFELDRLKRPGGVPYYRATFQGGTVCIYLHENASGDRKPKDDARVTCSKP